MSAVYRYRRFDRLRVELPKHWEEKALKFVSLSHNQAFVDGPFGSDLKSSEYVDEGIPLIQLNNIRDGRHIMRNMKFVTEEKKTSLSRHIARPGDLVFAKMAEPVARTALVSNQFAEYVIVADCVKMTADEHLVDTSYLVWAINSDCVRITAELVSTGTTRIRISLGELKRLRIPFPPMKEQSQISKFLEYETAKIDALIEKQQQLIALLKEKRQAVISHAVTKGLNPDAPMRDSGVEWLGEVPAHWEVKRLKHCLDGNGIQMGPFGTSLTNVSRERKAYRVYGQSNTISGNFSDVSRWLTAELFRPLSQYRLEPRDIVLTRKGSLGNCRVVPDDIAPGIMDSDTIRVRTRGAELAPEYLATLMHNAKSVETQIELNRRGAILPGLNSTVVGGLLLAVPPTHEQYALLDSIGLKLQKIDRIVDRVDDQISCLTERRTALISAAVTGKIDVRDWKPLEAEANVA